MHVNVVGRGRQVVENYLNCCGVLGNVENRDFVGAACDFGVQKGRLRPVPRPATTINVLQRPKARETNVNKDDDACLISYMSSAAGPRTHA